MKNLFSDRRGVSLPLTIGLLVILMISAITSHQLIIRSLRAANRIESADKAYFAAEAGIETALYELSPHFAGYETPDFTDPNARSHLFESGSSAIWRNAWEIKNRQSVSPTGDFSGRLYKKQKLIVNLFTDDTGVNPVGTNAINTVVSSSVTQLDASSNFAVTFQIPFDDFSTDPPGYSDVFLAGLTIDNDNDGSVNEDGAGDTGTCPPLIIPTEDADCDGKDNEDSAEDPVVYWRITDDEGRSLVPRNGCWTDGLGGVGTGTELCEQDFFLNASRLEVTLDQGMTGLASDGNTVDIGSFIAPNYDGRSPGSKVQIEFLVVAPLVQNDNAGGIKEIPYLEYLVDTELDSGGFSIPLPVFTIRSDGWFQDFKQSITSTLIPKESVPLLDITIIQQQQ